MKRFAIVVAALLSSGFFNIPPAAADLRVCNQTSYVLYAAVGYEAGVQMLTRGWTRVRPGDCATALQGVLNQPSYFIYARSSRAHAGPTRGWGGRIRLCAKETNFAIDVPVGAVHCASDDAFLVPFASISTGRKASWTTTLSDAAHFATPAAARTAGVTRLLGDIGYKIDASSPPKAVAQAVADFRLRMRLPANAGDADLLDALETEALMTSAPAGYSVCNEGTAEIWAAIGFNLNRGRAARGWWDVPPGGCARILTEPLNFMAVYLHVTRIGNPNLVGGPVMFCTGTGSFALPATPCKGEGHTALGFVETPTKGLSGYVAHIGNSGLLPPPPKFIQPRAAK
ncbi:MAG TPA: DUF1036 domain-containing protein [Rhizomicrobium sp.]|jgi:uncharacterized membrane protein|nr:DUF1036 domain-containing protein [Rhizomicrobium sp.]